MQYFTINFFDNISLKYRRKEVTFYGDLQTAIIFAVHVAPRLKIFNYRFTIYNIAGYKRGDKPLYEENVRTKRQRDWERRCKN